MADDERKTNQERDSFVKTTCVAVAANYIALNRQVPIEDAVKIAMRAAPLLWEELQLWREKQ